MTEIVDATPAVRRAGKSADCMTSLSKKETNNVL